MQQPQLTAIIGLRVSSPSQVNKAINPEGYSIPVQRESTERYCQQMGANIVREFIEPGVSAKDMADRPIIKELLAALDELKPDLLVFHDLSRWVRNEFDSAWLWREVVERRGVLIQSTIERIDDTDSGRLLYTVMGAVNANRIRGDARKVKLGLERKFLEGGHQGPAPIGYLNDKLLLPGREVRVVKLDPDREDLVRQGFDLFATGNFSLATLTDALGVLGLRYRATAKMPERPMTRSSVHRMLSDDFYIGIVTFKGQKRRGIHDALIEETTFERVQQVLAAHRASGNRGRKHDHFLVGDIFICDTCGCRLGYGRHRGKLGGTYEYFSCLSRVRPTGPCGTRYLQVDPVEQAVATYHETLLYTDEQQEQLRQTVRDFVTSRVESARKQAEIHRRRLAALKAEQKNLIQLAHKGLVDDEVLVEEQERIKTERDQARRLIEHATHEVTDIMETLDEALSLVGPTFPYAEADDPVLWELINQATHLEIRPYIKEDWDGSGTPPVLARGRRDPFYEAADTVLGLSRHGGCTAGPDGLGMGGVRRLSQAPRFTTGMSPARSPPDPPRAAASRSAGCGRCVARDCFR
jgi:site-specific DNA recombinase